ncbi:MAG: MerR family transcriptional regulator [Spirulina sp. SIO3F2]|nr:MerR family transcriptional regulator [Spirulina sp. SIO3F2]
MVKKMLIGELCKQADVTKDCIRHYESLGLIHSTPRLVGSRTYREYDEETLKRLELIKYGKSLLFTLREIKPLLDLFMSNQLPKAQRRQRLKQKLSEVEDKIHDAQRVQQKLIEKIKALE